MRNYKNSPVSERGGQGAIAKEADHGRVKAWKTTHSKAQATKEATAKSPAGDRNAAALRRFAKR